jgi:enoyl-CoA hydratase
VTESRFVRVEHLLHVSTITISRPEKMNALDAEVLTDLENAIGVVRDREETRCAIVTGDGRAFVAGADIAAMSTMSSEQALVLGALGLRVFASLEALRFPVIAAVNGFALGGGCELALACDFIHASSKAKFGLPEVSLGVVPGFGGTQRLVRRVGIGMAREWIFSGRIYDAAEAVRVGVANRVHEPEALLPAVHELAIEIASRGPLALAAAKRVMREGSDLPLEVGTALELEAFGALFGTEDRKTGMEAFLSKQAPVFVGR